MFNECLNKSNSKGHFTADDKNYSAACDLKLTDKHCKCEFDHILPKAEI